MMEKWKKCKSKNEKQTLIRERYKYKQNTYLGTQKVLMIIYKRFTNPKPLINVQADAQIKSQKTKN